MLALLLIAHVQVQVYAQAPSNDANANGGKCSYGSVGEYLECQRARFSTTTLVAVGLAVIFGLFSIIGGLVWFFNRRKVGSGWSSGTRQGGSGKRDQSSVEEGRGSDEDEKKYRQRQPSIKEMEDSDSDDSESEEQKINGDQGRGRLGLSLKPNKSSHPRHPIKRSNSDTDSSSDDSDSDSDGDSDSDTPHHARNRAPAPANTPPKPIPALIAPRYPAANHGSPISAAPRQLTTTNPSPLPRHLSNLPPLPPPPGAPPLPPTSAVGSSVDATPWAVQNSNARRPSQTTNSSVVGTTKPLAIRKSSGASLAPSTQSTPPRPPSRISTRQGSHSSIPPVPPLTARRPSEGPMGEKRPSENVSAGRAHLATSSQGPSGRRPSERGGMI